MSAWWASTVGSVKAPQLPGIPGMGASAPKVSRYNTTQRNEKLAKLVELEAEIEQLKASRPAL